MARRKYGDGGFTLIELLLVVIVLGILAAIVVMAVGALRHTSNEAVCRTQVQSIDRASEMLRARLEVYPPDADALSPGLFVASNGGPLRSWPTSSDYRLAWNGTTREVDVYDLPQNVKVGSGPGACGSLGSTSATTVTTAVVGSGGNPGNGNNGNGNNGNGGGNGNGNGGVGNGTGNGNANH